MPGKDYYKILGLQKGASKDEIKKAFRKMAAQYHPDKKTGDEAKFKEVSEAYTVLGDDKKRAEYDAYGQAFGSNAAGGFGGFDWQNMNGFSQNSFEFDLGDIFQNFGDMFGGGFGRKERRRGRDISIDIELDFKEAVFGSKRKVLLTKNNVCIECQGSGAKPGSAMRACETCNGQGRIRETRRSIMGSFTTVRECDVCHGKGQVPKELCKFCNGEGVRRVEQEIDINIPGGIENGEMMRLTGQGEAMRNGVPGDLYVKLHVRPHPSIKREGQNLISNLPIKLSDALLGANYKVETLDGVLEVKIPAGVKHGEMLRIKGKGVVSGLRRGDFLVRLAVEMPNKLSRTAKKLIEELRREGI